MGKLRSLFFKWGNPVFWSFDDEHIAQWTCLKTKATKVITTPKISPFENGEPITEIFIFLGAPPVSSENEAIEMMFEENKIA